MLIKTKQEHYIVTMIKSSNLKHQIEIGLNAEQLLEHYFQFAESQPSLKILENPLHVDDEAIKTLRGKIQLNDHVNG